MTTPTKRGLRTEWASRLADYCRVAQLGGTILPAASWPESQGLLTKLRKLGWSQYAAVCLELRSGRSLLALRCREASSSGQVYEVIQLDGLSATLASWRVEPPERWTLVEPPLDVSEAAVADYWHRADPNG